jgi:sugar lactone lactonase YvrE
MLGGVDGKTLFVMAAEWRGMAGIPDVIKERTGRVLAIDVDVPGAGWP